VASNFTRSEPDHIGELIRLAEHPEVLRLAAIFATAEQLSEEIKNYLADHPGGCRCACCLHWKGYGYTPTVRDHLIAMYTLLHVSADVTHEERPAASGDHRVAFLSGLV
jgi:hypothetical protein